MGGGLGVRGCRGGRSLCLAEFLGFFFSVVGFLFFLCRGLGRGLEGIRDGQGEGGVRGDKGEVVMGGGVSGGTSRGVVFWGLGGRW